MKRILVTGNVGSGKTTLSSILAEKFGLPLIHLDNVVWGPGWKEIPKLEAQERIGRVISEPFWVIDGVSSQACEAADMIIFLDLPISICLRRALRRTVRHLFSQRDEVPANCPEIGVIGKMLRILFKFNGETRPKILSYQNLDPSRRFIRIQSEAECHQFILKDKLV